MCSDGKAAIKALEAAGREVDFREVRANPLTEAEWAPLIAQFGDNLVDRKSQTYRNLNAWLRESEADVLLDAQPALVAVLSTTGPWAGTTTPAMHGSYL
ncbi:arsenate reductase family protein [Loktanella sp. S4079]|uniref:arsenate reductase family protein n=1 Tax=Loktanella sp. S4079 TaxID=579483 RepID=UPI0008DE8E04|nr:hypothetical protein [Loktanella sp. S4079]